ncbi:hypothetical protein PMI39_020035 [Pantoea sp. YR343]|uniref:hypothetical protein n=1 Tax=Pantoea sp. YR343 TaxID=1144341 RepID=UPI0002714A32|nr:hypothetical protein [Pantoea sp. YR343]KAJ9430782.1 hypothetical protein PMI39_020035 [Pantoea sp. YR343]
MDEVAARVKKVMNDAVGKNTMSKDGVEKFRKYGGNVLTFLIMHFVYFPFVTWCLLINYMTKNSFFSYDIISENFFAVSITTTFLMAMLGFLSLAMWGWIGYRILVSKGIINSEKGVSIPLMVMNGFFIIIMILQCFIVSNRNIILSASFLSLVLIIYYSYYFSASFKVKLVMIGFLGGLSAFFIFVYGDFSSAFFGKALNMFGLGGERRVSVIFNDRSYENHIGKLLLLTPEFIYFVENGRTIIVPMLSVKKLDISPLAKPKEDDE